MVAALAHDLRTPLAIVQGHVEGLLEGGMKNPERLERYLWTIDKNTKRAARLVQDMNRVAEMEVPQFRLNLHEVNVRVFVEEKASDIERLCEERNIEFRCSLTGREADHQRAMLDADKVSEPAGQCGVQQLALYAAGRDDRLGDGMRARQGYADGNGYRPRIPARYDEGGIRQVRAGDAARPRNKGHAGLGLYMAKLIAEKHGAVSMPPIGRKEALA